MARIIIGFMGSGKTTISSLLDEDYVDMDAVIVAVAHTQFLNLKKSDIGGFFHPVHKKKVFMDIKGLFDREEYLTEDYLYWRL